MKALRLEADWEPRPDASGLQPQDVELRRARRANEVLRHPRVALVDMRPREPRDDELLIRVRACGLCGSDLHFVETDRDGYMLYPGLVQPPVVIGHEFSGVVEAIGPRVRDFRVGEPVTAEEMAWCGDCFACRAGRPNNCTRIEELGFSLDGAAAELVIVRERYAWSLAPMVAAGVDDQRMFRLGALVEPTSVAYVALFVSAGGFAPGSSVGVVGAGPIGLAAISLARAAGAARVVAVEPSTERRALAQALGADSVFEPGDDAAWNEPLDVWVEASGAKGVVERMAASVAPAGKVVLIGRGPHRVDLDPEHVIVPGASVHGSIGHSGSGAFGRVIALMAAGRLPIDAIVSREVSLPDAAALLSGSPARDAGKTIVLPGLS